MDNRDWHIGIKIVPISNYNYDDDVNAIATVVSWYYWSMDIMLSCHWLTRDAQGLLRFIQLDSLQKYVNLSIGRTKTYVFKSFQNMTYECKSCHNEHDILLL